MVLEIPSLSDVFKSYYHQTTYLKPVDLSKQALSKHLFSHVNPDLAHIAQTLISQPDVQTILSEPLSYDRDEILKNNKVLQSYGFKLLGSKPYGNCGAFQKIIFYSVIEHQKLPGWIIKAGAVRVSKDYMIVSRPNRQNEIPIFQEEESILRIKMAKRLKKMARQMQIDVIIPQKKLISYANADLNKEVTKKYCVICEKIDVLNSVLTIEKISKLTADEQRILALNLSRLIQITGLVDASFDNIRLTTDGRLAILDTEPAGLMCAKKEGIWNYFFGDKGSSLEKCARLGMFTLLRQTLNFPCSPDIDWNKKSIAKKGLKVFHCEIKNEYEKLSQISYSRTKIILSIASLGLIAIAHSFLAHFTVCYLQSKRKKISLIDENYRREVYQLQGHCTEKQEQVKKKYDVLKAPFLRQFYRWIEGIPFTSSNA